MPSVVFDEDGTDRFRPPPHPDDRLWRHPSELGSHATSSLPTDSSLPDKRSAGSSLPASSHRRVRARGTRSERSSGPRLSVLLLAGGVGAASAAAALVVLGIPGPFSGGHQGDDPVALDKASASPTDDPTGYPLADDPPSEDASSPERRATPEVQDAPAHGAETQRAVVGVEGSTGHGSGVLAESDGTDVVVITSADLFEREPGEAVTVQLADGEAVAASVQGSDVLTNIAVLALPEGDYPTASVADAATGRGSDVSLIERLDGGTVDVSEGTVASSSWRVERSGLPALNGLLQISTPGGDTEPGAPVMGPEGRVVGIIVGSTGDWHHATPIEVATKVSDDIVRTGEADHARLGIEGYDVTEATVDEAARAGAGVYVSAVISDSPVSEHLRSGDVIVTLGGVPLTDIAALQTALLLHSPGDEVEITYHRGSSDGPRTVSVTLDAR